MTLNNFNFRRIKFKVLLKNKNNARLIVPSPFLSFKSFEKLESANLKKSVDLS